MFKKTQHVLIEVTSIVGTTTVFVVLILFPMSIRHLYTIARIFWNNIGMVPSMFSSLMQIRREENIPYWKVILGLPFIALFVLLEEYE